MKALFTSLLFLFLLTDVFASGIKGYVRNDTGDPLEFATIYVRETGSGTISNVDGFYEIKLRPGTYTLDFQYLGYDAYTERIVVVKDNFQEKDIRLSKRVLELVTVEVIDGGENPAYTVMRKAIAKADYHRQQLDYYKTQVYIKGTGRLSNVPGIARRMLEREGVDTSMAYTSESVSIVEYFRPNTYNERVISVYTNGNDNGSSPMQFINGSFYEKDLAGSISPLSPRAFGYYKFELAGYFSDRDFLVNKIKVTPRSRGDNVFEGYIYIVEDLWSIHSVDMATYKFGIRFDIEQVFAPIQEDVWLPVSHQYDVTGKVFGFGFEYLYLATASNYEIQINPDLDVDFQVIDEKIDEELAREAEARLDQQTPNNSWSEKLDTGEELTRKDLRRMMKDYEQQEQQEQEAPEVVENRTYTVDSLAYVRDSSYWEVIRPVPLTKFEVRGYKVEDSLRTVAVQTAENEANGVTKKNWSDKKFSPLAILFGTSFKLGTKTYLHYKGINNLGFNPVEGYWLQSELALQHRNKNDNRFRIGFVPRYGFSWEKLVAKGYADYKFGREDFRQTLLIEGGSAVAQYNDPNGVNQLFNTFYALFGRRNYLRIYEKDYLAARWNKNWESTATLSLSAEWANRSTLTNTTNHTWFKGDDHVYLSNRPFAETLIEDLPATEKAAFVEANFSIKPWQKYRINNGERSASGSLSPAFSLNIRQGIPDLAESVTDYTRLGLTYRQTIVPGARGILDIKVDMGLFVNDNYVGFADYRHFAGNQMVFTTSDPVGAFRLLPYYQYSTNDKWAAAHVHYQFRKFLFTRIWEVQMMGIKENVFVNHLQTPGDKAYTEIGYGIDNIFRFFRLEGVAAFRNGEYHDWGIRIGVAAHILGGFGSVEVGD